MQSLANVTSFTPPPRAGAIEVRNVGQIFKTKTQSVEALSDVSLDVRPGRFIVLVGPSGCGKSTLLMMMAGLRQQTSGTILINGRPIPQPDPDRVGVVFQEPSLFPWLTAEENVEFPLTLRGVAKSERRAKAEDALKLVGLAGFEKRHPHELSGGMKQRVCIAIGILLQPNVIIADEPTSALDVVTQRQVMETINKIQDEINAAVILIGHDMGLMAQTMDRIAVMYAGRLVELSTVREMFTDPKHPYSQALISSLPTLDNRGNFKGIPGLAPSLHRLPSGCAFHPRCPHGQLEPQRTVRPETRILPGGRMVACHLYDEEGHRHE
jgi:oligopeptide/dipeptide ABC transporter ATP-binding protein